MLFSLGLVCLVTHQKTKCLRAFRAFPSSFALLITLVQGSSLPLFPVFGESRDCGMLAAVQERGEFPLSGLSTPFAPFCGHSPFRHFYFDHFDSV
jgi:hypothetical protein